VCPCFGGGDNVAWAEAYLCTKWHLDPSSRLATIDMGRKLGGECAPCLGAGSPSSTMSPRLRPAPYQVTKWYLDAYSRLATIDMGGKFGRVPLFWSPANTKSPGPRSTSIPSGILVYPAVWPQRTWAANWGGCAPLGEGELGPNLTQCRLG